MDIIIQYWYVCLVITMTSFALCGYYYIQQASTGKVTATSGDDTDDSKEDETVDLESSSEPDSYRQHRKKLICLLTVGLSGLVLLAIVSVTTYLRLFFSVTQIP